MDIADDDIQLAKRVEELIERGLGRYGNGDMEGALSEWKHALALDPDSERAASYLHYVEDHLELSASDGDVHNESTIELTYPFGLTELGLTQLGGEGLDEYESIQIMDSDSAGPGAGDITRTDRARAPIEGLDDGWGVDEAWAEELVTKSESAFALSAKRAPLQPDRSGSATRPARGHAPLDESSFADLELALSGEDDQEPTQARGRSAPGLVEAELELLSLSSHEGDEAPTIAPSSHSGDEAPTIARRSPSHGLRRDGIEPGDTGVGTDSSGAEDYTRPGGAAGVAPTELGSDAMAAMRQHTALDFALGEESTAERSGASAHGFDELELESLESTLGRPEIPDAIDDESHPAVSLGLDDDSPAENAMDEELTIDRGGLRAAGLVAGLPESREDSGLLPLELDIGTPADADQDATCEISISEPASSSDDVLARVMADAPPGSDGERTLYIVGRLIKIAEREFSQGNYAAAATAASCALECADDSAVAQKVVFENERTILQVLIGNLGKLSNVPELLIQLTEIPLDQIDHRAAFLLTRMDGTLTLEEILDVSGMPRMEALRHLSRIHAKGFIRFG